MLFLVWIIQLTLCGTSHSIFVQPTGPAKVHQLPLRRQQHRLSPTFTMNWRRRTKGSSASCRRTNMEKEQNASALRHMLQKKAKAKSAEGKKLMRIGTKLPVLSARLRLNITNFCLTPHNKISSWTKFWRILPFAGFQGKNDTSLKTPDAFKAAYGDDCVKDLNGYRNYVTSQMHEARDGVDEDSSW